MDALMTPDVKDAVDEKVIVALRNCALFRALKPEQIPQLAKAGEIVRFEAGDSIITQGDPSDSFFAILEGEAGVVIDRHGEAIGLGSIPTPVSVGEVGLLLGEPRTATVIARSAVLTLRFSARAFEAMFKKIPSFGEALSSGLAHRLHHVSGRVQLPAHDPTGPTRRPRCSTSCPWSCMQRHRVAARWASKATSSPWASWTSPRPRCWTPCASSSPASSCARSASRRPSSTRSCAAAPGVKELAREERARRPRAREATLGPARQAAGAGGGGRAPPTSTSRPATSRTGASTARCSPIADAAVLGPEEVLDLAEPGDGGAPPRAVRAGQRHRLRLRAPRRRPLPRQRVPRPPRRGARCCARSRRRC